MLEDGHCVRTIHAEHNAILQAAIVPGMSTEGATLYTKYSPCIHCAKYVISAKIKRIVIGKFYRNEQVIPILKAAGIEVEVYKENPEWNAIAKNLFEGEIPEIVPKEGAVKLADSSMPQNLQL